MYFTGKPTCWRIATTTPALGGAVELRQHDAGAVDRLGKVCRLADAVLAGGGVEHQQHLVRRLGDELADRGLNLRQLGHQVLLRLQPAGRVDDADVDLLRDRLLDGSIGDRRRDGRPDRR